MDKEHLKREKLVKDIYNIAKTSQYVVIGSPAGTGKTSLIQLLVEKLQKENAHVIRLGMSSLHDAGYFMNKLIAKGVDPSDPMELQKLENTWLLLDDAQRTYDQKYNPFWESLVKDIASADAKGVFVVIAATYDISTPESPACFRNLLHFTANIEEKEAKQLLDMHFFDLGISNWEQFRSTLLKLSVLQPWTDKSAELPSFHIGVLMAGIFFIVDRKKRSGESELTEETALDQIRGRGFIEHLKRCFGLDYSKLQPEYKDRLLDAVIGRDSTGAGEIVPEDAALGPFVRAGVLSETGKFTTNAAVWFYNDQCFPNRATEPPDSLDSLVLSIIPQLSTKRLTDTLENGFPKEATFQHLFNEEMSKLLTFTNKVIPELNTYVEPSPGSDGTGELDFYINGRLKWCLELLRGGDKVKKHLNRFDPVNGKYRKVPKNDYLVVDCRGPKIGRGCKASPHRCTLYFSEDFKTCHCKMRMEEEQVFTLAN